MNIKNSNEIESKKASKPFVWVVLGIFALVLVSVVAAALEGDLTVLPGDVQINGDLMDFVTPDSTIRLYADGNDLFSEGNSIEFYAMNAIAKPYLAWYDQNGDPTGWFGCHYALSNGDVHEHCSIETMMTDGMNTRFEVTYGDDPKDEWVRVRGVGNFILGQGVDLQLTGPYSDIESSSTVDIYPNNQGSKGFRVTNDDEAVQIQGLGSPTVQVLDDFEVGSEFAPKSIIMTSEDGTRWSCSVSNLGEFECSEVL